MTQRPHLYVFKPGRTLPPGRSANRDYMTTIAISHAEYHALLKLCGGADCVLRDLAREVSLSLAAPAPGKSWTDTVRPELFKAAWAHDAAEQAHADANNAAHAA